MHQKDVDGRLLTVKETADYRWFEYGGNSVQSLMSKTTSEKTVTPVSQSLLVFLLFDIAPLRILNLGLGGASLERALTALPNVLLTSVDASQSVIDIAKRYFNLPKDSYVVCQKAEVFIQQTKSEFDVVICDLFIDEKNPGFLYAQDFYSQLNEITSHKAVVVINTQAESEEQLLGALLSIRKYFSHIALIEFEGYKNIVIISSSHEIPAREILQKRLKSFTQVALSGLDNVIENMRYIPA